MKSVTISTLLSLAAVAVAGPTIYMAGDSTMVAGGNNDGTAGAQRRATAT
jgi:rhamnogalacturonan acetylesterase